MNRSIRIRFCIALFLFPTVLFSQEIVAEQDGIRIENNGNIEAYFKNGVRDGVFKTYNRKNGKLSSFGEFREGKKSATWYYFDEDSRLILTECKIEQNKNYIRFRDDGVKIVPNFTSYAKFYYPNGYVKEEGRILYSEDIEIDYYKTGSWKYYDISGALKETKKH